MSNQAPWFDDEVQVRRLLLANAVLAGLVIGALLLAFTTNVPSGLLQFVVATAALIHLVSHVACPLAEVRTLLRLGLLLAGVALLLSLR